MRHAVTSSTGMECFAVILSAVVVAGVGVAVALACEKIADFEQELEQIVAGMALAGAPVAILIWIFKVRSFCGKLRNAADGAAEARYMLNVHVHVYIEKAGVEKYNYLCGSDPTLLRAIASFTAIKRLHIDPRAGRRCYLWCSKDKGS